MMIFVREIPISLPEIHKSAGETPISSREIHKWGREIGISLADLCI